MSLYLLSNQGAGACPINRILPVRSNDSARFVGKRPVRQVPLHCSAMMASYGDGLPENSGWAQKTDFLKEEMQVLTEEQSQKAPLPARRVRHSEVTLSGVITRVHAAVGL